MALAGSQSNRPRLPPVPQALPTTQPAWDRLVNVFQQWRSAMLPKWITPTLSNGWVYYGSPYEPPGYYMDVSGVVHLRGLIKSGTVGVTMFTLPAGFAPPYTLIVPAMSADALCEIRVDTGGNVIVTTGGSGTWVSLSGISFSTTP